MQDKGLDYPYGCVGLMITLVIAAVPAWFTHIVSTINNEQWLFLIAGAIFPPIGIVHGWGIWFGFF